MKYIDLKNDAPKRMSREAILTLDRGYLLKNETPNGMFRRLCDKFATYYPNGYKNLSSKQLRDLLYDCFQKGWLSPSSPIAANFGTDRGLPFSCFGLKPSNSINGIFKTAWEAAMLTKNGGGIGIDISDLVGESNITSWSKLYDTVMNIVSQSGVRRGSVAQYINIEHPNFWELMEQKELSKGDKSNKILCNIAVIIEDTFMYKLFEHDVEAISRFSKVLELGMKYGSPYIHFSDNVKRADPPWYKDKGLITTHSQLCSEISLFSDSLHTFTCVLMSLNLRYFYEWFSLIGITLPELAILFLDAVCQEYIEKVESKADNFALQNSLRSVLKGRPLGLGVYGLHALYQKENLPFESKEARVLNDLVFSYMNDETMKATKELAKMFGEPEWCKGWGIRNTHRMAIAPTTTSSIIGGGISPGIEPLDANYFVKAGAKGTFVRKNPFLEELLEEKGKNTDLVWKRIRKDRGSVQGLNFLTEEEKAIFKIFPEIDPEAIIRQAADRQKYIDQSQSLNLYIKPDEDAQKIIDWHILAWQLGVKNRYYIRSESFMSQQEQETYIHIKSRPDCIFCKKAKELLSDRGITTYTEEFKANGKVPEIWINGEVLPDGFNSLQNYFDISPEIEDNKDCLGCSG